MVKKGESRISFTMIIMVITGVLITVTGIIYKQPLLRILPLYISLVISYLQSKVNRYASLLGSFNSILYAIVYVLLHIYGSAAYALLISFPMQLITFFRWSKKPWGQATVFRKLSDKQKFVTAVLSVASWITLFFALRRTDADYIVLDCTGTLLGVLTAILMMLSFVEYAGLMLINCFVTIVLYVIMVQEIPAQITYLIYTLYSGMCTAMAYKRSRKMLAEQEKVNE